MVRLNTTRRFTKNALFILVPLLLINAGVAHILVKQISIRASADNRQVLDASVSATEEGNASSDNSPEEILATDNKPLITTYKVVSGDTISQIAEKFGISTNTIRWANNMTSSSTIKVGQELTILPVTGIQYTVKNGDTISGITVKFNASQADILDFNDIDSADKIKPGVELIIPDGAPIVPPKPVKTVTKKVTTTKVETTTKSDLSDGNTDKDSTSLNTNKTGQYFINPIPGSQLTQALHDGTAVDLGAKSGTEVIAAASGTVITAKDSNTWNGGYGYYIVIQHDNGTKTLYAHLSRIDVEVGDDVEQGEHIALSGRTGHVTGPHLHFEVRGGTNPFGHDKIGTRY